MRFVRFQIFWRVGRRGLSNSRQVSVEVCSKDVIEFYAHFKLPFHQFTQPLERETLAWWSRRLGLTWSDRESVRLSAFGSWAGEIIRSGVFDGESLEHYVLEFRSARLPPLPTDAAYSTEFEPYSPDDPLREIHDPEEMLGYFAETAHIPCYTDFMDVAVPSQLLVPIQNSLFKGFEGYYVNLVLVPRSPVSIDDA